MLTLSLKSGGAVQAPADWVLFRTNVSRGALPTKLPAETVFP